MRRVGRIKEMRRKKAAYGVLIPPPEIKIQPLNTSLKMNLSTPTKYLKQKPTTNLLELEHKIDSTGYEVERQTYSDWKKNPPTAMDYIDAGLGAASLLGDALQVHPLTNPAGRVIDYSTNVGSALIDYIQLLGESDGNLDRWNLVEGITNTPPTNKFDYVGDIMSIQKLLTKLRQPGAYIPLAERRQVKQDNTYVDVNKNNISYSLENKAYGGYLTEEILPEKYVMKRRLNRRKAAFGVPTSPMEALAQDNIYRDTALSQASQVLDPIMAGINQGLDLAGEALSAIPGEAWNAAGSKMTGEKWKGAYGMPQEQIPVEVEGGETAQLPNGEMIGFNGNLHENGGIDVDLPEGTEIYSQRLTKDGETLAERKLKRERTMDRVRRKQNKRSTDNLYNNTVERLQMIADYQEAQDQAYQDGVRNLVNQIYGEDSGVYPQFNAACGGRVKAPYGDDLIAGKSYFEKPLQIGVVQFNPDGSIEAIDENNIDPKQRERVDVNQVKLKRERKNNSNTNWNNFLSSATLGNLNVLAGNMYQGIAPYLTTLKQREGDMPNVNTFRDYNKDAIRSIQDAMDASVRTRDTQLADLELRRRSDLNAARNLNRGANGLAALSTAIGDTYNQGTEKVYNAYQDNYNKLLAQLSGLQSDRDLKYMTAEDQRNERDTQDRDAFYRNLAKDNAEIGRAIAQSGKDLNAMRLAVYNSNLINQLSKYGIGIDRNGNLYELPKKEQAYGGRVRRTSRIRKCK